MGGAARGLLLSLYRKRREGDAWGQVDRGRRVRQASCMSMQAFTRNHSDHSNNTGFQFEFFCDKCGNGWRSAFVTSKTGFAAGILGMAGSFFGGGFAAAANAGNQAKDLLRGKAWDSAFADAVAEGKGHFKQCTR